MNKRATILAVTALALCALFLPASAPAQRAERPNVVLLLTDDQTLASLRFMAQTRALLVSEGTSFSRAISTFPLCCPSRATLLTGQYSHNHGVIHNAGAFGGYTGVRQRQLPCPCGSSSRATGRFTWAAI